MQTETILKGLIDNKQFFAMALPHMEEDFFFDPTDALLFSKIHSYFKEYNKQPLASDVKLLLQNDLKLTERETQDAIARLKSSVGSEPVSEDILIKETERWCQQRALEVAVMKSMSIIEKKPEEKGQLPDLIKQALAVSFHTQLGHSFFRDAPSRYEYYTDDVEIIKLDCDTINQALGGGLRRKALYTFQGKTNVGKTLWLCHIATSLMRSGYNVLYVTGEMSAEAIAQRMDANLLNYEMGELGKALDKKQYLSRVRELYGKVKGRLEVKYYDAGTCNALTVKNLLREYKMKEGFVPDVVIYDYINLFGSYRLPASALTNTYLYVKFVTEELRSVGNEFNHSVVTATQFNRTGAKAGKDAGMEDTADSYGLPMTADWMGAIIQNEELFNMMKYLLKTVKSRFGENIGHVYTLGVDRAHMRLKDLPPEQQELPVHIKDQLAVAAKKLTEKNEMEVTKELLDGFDFEG